MLEHGITHAELAELSGYRKPHVAKVLSRETSSGLATFIDLLRALPVAARHTAMDLICSMLGGSFVTDAQDAPEQPLELRPLAAIGRAGELSKTVAASLADGQITQDELPGL